MMGEDMWQYPDGSNWTAWDLHIHTPATLLSNSFEGADEPKKWEKYFRAVADSGLHVIAPTNYFCLDGFIEVVNALDQGLLGDVTCVLPNIEFRIDQSNKDGSHIHVHVIFSDKFTRNTDPIQSFLDNLKLLTTTGDGKEERCTRQTVSRLGPDKLLIPLRELDEKLQGAFTRLDDYIFIAGCRGLGNFRPGANDSRGDTLAIEIDKMCDIIYGSSDEDREFFLNSSRYPGAVEKPVLVCSDSHSSADVGSKRTWIRANPTYEGLKQAAFEPELRVSLSDPVLEKSLYSTVQSVRLHSPTDDSMLFQDQEIPLNSDLTVIIGGKSTGKSLLLHYLARTVDEQQVFQREAIVLGPGVRHYDFDEHPGFDVEVRWSDGHTQVFSNRASDTLSRSIVYIPQRFLNGICELQAPAGSRSLDSFTREALRQKPALAAAFDTLDAAVDTYERDLIDSLDRLFDQYTKYSDARKELSAAGDEDGVKAEIVRLDGEIARIRDASKMTAAQKSTYASLAKEIADASAAEEELKSDGQAIDAAEDAISRAVTRFQAAISELLASLQHPKLKTVAATAFSDLDSLSAQVDAAFKSVNTESKALAEQLAQKRQTAEEAMKPLAKSIEGQQQIEALSKKRVEETQRLSLVQALAKKLEGHRRAIIEEVDKLERDATRLIAAHDTACYAMADESDALGDISFDAKVVFNVDEFNLEFVHDAVKLHSLKSCLGVTGQYEFTYDPDTHVQFLTKVSKALLTGKIERMKGVSLRQALNALYENRLMFDYQIQYRGDQIESMSPGKLALVVLKILLELTSDEWPILLDQPDDDIDSRSVYRELVRYFKEKKKTRQIVLVTHNPNLVVGSDADEVIVANQSGQEPGRDNLKYRFEYVSGALECTFQEPEAQGILNQQGIREHVCEVLEGGSDAFMERERKYRLG
jgi:hypothetical protein